MTINLITAKAIRNLRGFVTLSLLTLSSLFIPSLLALSGIIKISLPKVLKPFFIQRIEPLEKAFYRMNHMIIKLCIPTAIENKNPSIKLDNTKKYALICNHKSWLDIIILQTLLIDTLPPLRFFLKDSLKWIPMIGPACWALDFLFIKRYSKSEIKKDPRKKHANQLMIAKNCKTLLKRNCTLVNFVEGTRFHASKQHATSQYQQLLPPKGAGLSLLLRSMQPQIEHIIDATLLYGCKSPSLWTFCCGDIPSITLSLDKLEVQASMLGDFYKDPQFKQSFSTWLQGLWLKKDQQLIDFYQP
jgi:1-acyl-sn-glycerol-3-phosphate acyltransferase